jgi:GT2 family glycosyltransferase
MSDLGVVIIGRNEGERLRRCLESVRGRGCEVVYVDSNSSDDSVKFAEALGVEVVELDPACPFTAARARNAGFERLEEIAPDVRFVQFVDGDCEVVAGWLENARRTLERRPEVALVCGRRRERFPDQTVYNRLADIEWNTPIGEAFWCGGDAMIRADAFRRAGGYNAALIAGEEPELCVRLRQDGGVILRIDAEMTLHDLAMTRFSQWWRRTERAGFAYAAGAALHGASSERLWVRDLCRIVLWGILFPLVVVGFVWPTHLWSLALLLVYPLQVIRITWQFYRGGLPWRDAGLYGTACVVCRFPQALGVLRYVSSQLLGRRQALIEYKKNAKPSVHSMEECSNL